MGNINKKSLRYLVVESEDANKPLFEKVIAAFPNEQNAQWYIDKLDSDDMIIKNHVKIPIGVFKRSIVFKE